MSASSSGNGKPVAVVTGDQGDLAVAGGLTEPVDVPPVSPRADHPSRNRRGALPVKVAAFVVAIALAVLLLQAFVAQPFAVPGSAMAPTVQAGDRILVVKSGLLAGSVRRGEIVVFHPPQSMPCTVVGGRGGDLVLRVVALPGEVIRSVADTILVNGRALSQEAWHDPRFGRVGSTPIPSTLLAQGEYFVMADNRSEACDSRRFGPIPKASIVGEAAAFVGRHERVSFGIL